LKPVRAGQRWTNRSPRRRGMRRPRTMPLIAARLTRRTAWRARRWSWRVSRWWCGVSRGRVGGRSWSSAAVQKRCRGARRTGRRSRLRWRRRLLPRRGV